MLITYTLILLEFLRIIFVGAEGAHSIYSHENFKCEFGS